MCCYITGLNISSISSSWYFKCAVLSHSFSKMPSKLISKSCGSFLTQECHGKRLTEASSTISWFCTVGVSEQLLGSMLMNLTHFLFLMCSMAGYIRNPMSMTLPLTINVLIEAKHITRTSKKVGGMQITTAPKVSTGILYGLWRSGFFILSFMNAANSRSIPREYKKLRNSIISWKLNHDNIMTPVAEHMMLMVGVPYFDLQKYQFTVEIVMLSPNVCKLKATSNHQSQQWKFKSIKF